MILQQEGSAIDWHIIITRYFPLQLDPPVHELIWTLRFHDPPKDSVQISPVHGPNLKIFIMTIVEIIYLFSIFFKVVHSYTLTPAIQNLFFFFLIIIKLPFFFPTFRSRDKIPRTWNRCMKNIRYFRPCTFNKKKRKKKKERDKCIC